RPSSWSGALMAATGFGWFIGNFEVSGIAWIAWLGSHGRHLYRGSLLQLVLTYPRGRTAARLERIAVVGGYTAAIFVPVWRSEIATIALSASFVGVATHGYVTAGGPTRRERLAALQATSFVWALFSVGAVILTSPTQNVSDATVLAYDIALCALAVTLFAGLMSAPWEHVAVTDLVVDLGETQSGTLRDALARALGDPTLQL